MRKTIYGLCISLILCFLLIYPSPALDASRQGLTLWFDTLLPTLLPFLILSGFLIRANLADSLVIFMSPIMKKIFHITPYGCYAMLIGFFCGYPVGAKVISDLVKEEKINSIEAQYLLSFCNNASPAFVITFLVTEQLQKPAMLMPTLFFVYGIPLLWGIIQNPSYQKRLSRIPKQGLCIMEAPYGYPRCPKNKVNSATGGREGALGYVDINVKKAPQAQISFELIDACILDSVITITKLGGYIVMFSIIARMTTYIPFLSAAVKACITGITELTNGIPRIVNAFPYPECYLVLVIVTCFGGLSALAQTESVIKSAHLSLGKYFISKVCTCTLTACIAYLYLFT